MIQKANIKKLLDSTYIMACFYCDGTGAVNEGINCFKPASECCGGCITYSECTICNCTGELEADENTQDMFMMLSAIGNLLDKFKVIRKTFSPEASESMNSEYQIQELIIQEQSYEKLYERIYNDIKDEYRNEI